MIYSSTARIRGLLAALLALVVGCSSGGSASDAGPRDVIPEAALHDSPDDSPVCNDECATAGATRCTAGASQTCERAADGCNRWSTPSPCATGSCASPAACSVCEPACGSEGMTTCTDGALRTCIADANGCRVWGPLSACASGFCVDAMSCGTCTNDCAAAGATTCADGRIRTCVADSHGCLGLGSPTACPTGVCADANTCVTCTNECPSAGATECVGGEVRTCVADSRGCLVLGPASMCPSGFCADGASCGMCSNSCSVPGATECTGGRLRTCVADSHGCLSLGAPAACTSGFCADTTSCGSCSNSCIAGSAECTGGAIRSCVADANGCLSLGAPTACPSGFCADASTCGTCSNECSTAGATQCSGGEIRTCVADARGCLSLTAPSACPSGFCSADAASCGTCANTCSAAGATECSGGALRTCVADARGCLALGGPSMCPSGFCADATACGMCTNECALGDSVCSSSAVRTCVVDANGCRVWSAPTTCSDGCLDSRVCDPCHHECPTWGVSCSGNTLQTCVTNAMGCRVLLTQPCSLGCANGACTTCSSYASPILGSVLADGTRNFHELVTSGGAAFTDWTTLSGGSDGLATIDTSTPAAMTTRFDAALAGTSISNLDSVGNRFYFLGSSGLEIYDATNPATPTRLGGFAPGTSVMRSLSVTGSLACLGADDGLHLIDVTSPSSPSQLALFTSAVRPMSVRCVGNRAAIQNASYVQLVDITNPARPALIAQTALGGLGQVNGVNRLQFDGTTIYAVTSQTYNSRLWYSIESYALDTSGILRRLGSLAWIDEIRSTRLASSNLYVGNTNSVGLVDVSNPALPRWAEHTQSAAGGAEGVVFDAGTLFGSGGGLSSYDLTIAPDVVLLPVASADYWGGHAAIGSIGLEARRTRGLVITDLRSPRAPIVTSTIAMAAQDVVVRDHYALVAVDTGTASELRVYDVRSPWAPAFVTRVGASSDPLMKQLQIANDRLYALCGIGSVCIYDITVASSPTFIVASDVIVRTAGTASRQSTFAVDGDNLFIPNGSNFYSVDMRDPRAPVTLATVTLPSSLGSTPVIAMSGHVAYLASECGSAGTICGCIVDATNPSAPVVRSSFTHSIQLMRSIYPLLTPSQTRGIEIRGNRLLISHGWGGISSFDVTDPASPAFQTEYWTPLPAGRVFESDRFMMTYAYTAGLFPAPAAQTDQVIELCR